MALAKAIENARHTAQEVTWTYDDDTAVDLTGATITGFKKNLETGTVTALDGDLDITDATAGKFTWVYGSGDVDTPGHFKVQFVATYGANDVEKTVLENWQVANAIDDEVE